MSAFPFLFVVLGSCFWLGLISGDGLETHAVPAGIAFLMGAGMVSFAVDAVGFFLSRVGIHAVGLGSAGEAPGLFAACCAVSEHSAVGALEPLRSVFIGGDGAAVVEKLCSSNF